MVNKMEKVTNTVSLLIIEDSDDYIFSYAHSFDCFCPFYRRAYVKTIKDLKNKIKSANQYDVVLSKVFFKGLNWENLITYFKSNTMKTDAIIFTSTLSFTNPEIKRLVKSGYDYLEKPFEFLEIIRKINQKIISNHHKKIKNNWI